jgi:four helix bundle protein
MSENILLIKSKKFALLAIVLYKKLQEEKEYVISKQFLGSSTSIGANLHEAVAAQSKKDFYSKICIAFKEANETMYWIELLRESDLTNLSTSQVESDCEEIVRMLASTKMTTERNLEYQK